MKIPATFCTGLNLWENCEGLRVDCDPRRTETGGDRRRLPVSISTAGSFSLRSATVQRLGAVQERAREVLPVVAPSTAHPALARAQSASCRCRHRWSDSSSRAELERATENEKKIETAEFAKSSLFFCSFLHFSPAKPLLLSRALFFGSIRVLKSSKAHLAKNLLYIISQFRIQLFSARKWWKMFLSIVQ